VAFEGDEMVSGVVLDNGETLPADLVIVGIGIRPATEFIPGVPLADDGGVVADERLSIAKDLYAAGDIVHFRDARTHEQMRIEHWRIAMQQGRIAAHNMAGNAQVFAGVPFFWTTQFDVTLN